jgi:hypothetical protein
MNNGIEIDVNKILVSLTETDVCGMSYIEARKAANDPEWGYEA